MRNLTNIYTIKLLVYNMVNSIVAAVYDAEMSSIADVVPLYLVQWLWSVKKSTSQL